MKQNKNFKRGRFTLIEVVVVIVILVMLASIATPLYFRHVRNAKISTAKTQIKLIEQSLMDLKLDTGSYPESLEALTENATRPRSGTAPTSSRMCRRTRGATITSTCSPANTVNSTSPATAATASPAARARTPISTTGNKSKWRCAGTTSL